MKTLLFRPQTFTCSHCGEKLPEHVTMSVLDGATLPVGKRIMLTVRCAGVGCHTDHVYRDDPK